MSDSYPGPLARTEGEPMVPGSGSGPGPDWIIAPMPRRPIRDDVLPLAAPVGNLQGPNSNPLTPNFRMTDEDALFYLRNYPNGEDGCMVTPPPGMPLVLPPKPYIPPNPYDRQIAYRLNPDVLSQSDKEYWSCVQAGAAGFYSPPLSPSFNPDEQPESLRNISVNRIEISFSLYTWCKPKQGKANWEAIKRKGIRLPTNTVLRGIDLHTFKKIVAACCFMDATTPKKPPISLAKLILQNDQENKISWTFTINSSDEFPASAKVQVKDDAHFNRFLRACSVAGRRAMGIRVSMEDPAKLAKQKKRCSEIATSIKRTNRTYVGSDSESVDDSDATSSSIHTLEENDDEQRLESATCQIRKNLMAGNPGSGEVPIYRDPLDPKRFVRLTPALLTLWATDYLAKVPGVTIDTPPARPAFKTRTQNEWAKLTPEASTSTLEPQVSSRNPTAVAHSIKVPFEDFLHFAHIRTEPILSTTKAALDRLGIDHWSIFNSDFNTQELLDAGMAIGTVRKLFNAATHCPEYLLTSQNQE